jgi:hypothetical protein
VWLLYQPTFRRYVPSKYLFLQEPQEITSQTTTFFLVVSWPSKPAGGKLSANTSWCGRETQAVQCKIWGLHHGDYEDGILHSYSSANF